MNTNLKYGISDTPKTIKELLLYGLQNMLSILTATILISTICGTSVAAGLVAGGLATITFLCLTGFKVPLFFSNSGATVSAVLGALALSTSVEESCTAVVLGGLTICLMNFVFSRIIKKLGAGWIKKILPDVLVGTIILGIGINLMKFIPTYLQVNGAYSLVGIGFGLLTMLITALLNHYGRGIIPNLSFLIGLFITYALTIVITAMGIYPLVDLTQFHITGLFSVPDFSFLHLDFAHFNWAILPQIIILFACVNVGAVAESIGDILTCSQITETDLVSEVGVHKTMMADGIADLVGCLVGSQPTTTYGESLATIAVSKVASTRVIFTAAVMTCLLGFIQPFNAAIVNMPSFLFGGISILAYSFISLSGVKVLVNGNIDFDDSKNIIIFAVALALSVSGLSINIGTFSLSGVSIGVIVGILMNLILKEKQ
jgi:uracil permease